MRFILPLWLLFAPSAWAFVCHSQDDAAGGRSDWLLAQARPVPAEGFRLPLRIDPRLDLEPASNRQTPLYLSAQSVSGQFDDTIRLIGHAEVRQLGLSLKAQQADFDLVQNQLSALGDVQLFREGEFYQGPRLTLRLATQQGRFEDVSYEFAAMNARGHARLIEFVQPKEIQLSDVSFTTCPVDRPAWKFQSRSMLVDQVREIVRTEDTLLVWGDTPILSMGGISFPGSDRRKTGLLTPSYSFTSRLGFDLMVPFYWNMAPNYDMTLFPRAIGRRGFMLGVETRYLTPSHAGVFGFEYLPQDPVARADRHLLSLSQTSRLASGFDLALRGSWVSDDDYFADFGGSLLAASQRVLPATLSLSRETQGWASSVSLQRYQVLQDRVSPIIEPYAWMPRLSVSRADHAVKLSEGLPSLDWQAFFEATRFDHPTLARGDRFVGSGSVSMPLNIGFVSLTPKLGLHATQYVHSESGDLTRTQDKYFRALPFSANRLGVFANNVSPESQSYSRVLPTFSLDATTTLERDAVWGGDPAVHTIEPRILYALTPFKDQSRLPVFDSARPGVSLAQILSDQTFTGQDRIADQRHITTAVTSRMLDPVTGQERARASLAQRFYLSAQRVTLPGEPIRTDQESDLFAEGGISFSNDWRFDTIGQYTAKLGKWQAISANLRYDPRPGYSASLAYRFTRNFLDVVDFAFQVPLAQNWYGVGRYNYSFQKEPSVVGARPGLVEALAGVEYDGGCWVARVVLQRFVTGADQVNNAIFFQIELNGIARVGTDPLDALTRSIPNYRMINRLTPLPAKFDNFQ